MKALITGVTGQDGSYLAEFLLGKGYEVHGLVRPSSADNVRHIDHLIQAPHEADGRLKLHYGDLMHKSMLSSLVRKIRPDEVYHLAGQSHVGLSFEMPEYTADVNAMGTIRLMEAIREAEIPCKIYHSSSGDVFGNCPPPQNEDTPFEPCSVYGASKVFAHWNIVEHRTSYHRFSCNGILFNHESPRRKETFVTRKITRAVARIVAGEQQTLHVGNLEAKRDWGYAPEYVEAMWLMLQQEQAEDYVIATGESHSVRDFLTEAFSLVNLTWDHHVRVDDRYYRPTEIRVLCGDASKARRKLGWRPRTTFKDLVRLMVAADLAQMGLSLETGASIAAEEYRSSYHGNGQRLNRYTEVARTRVRPGMPRTASATPPVGPVVEPREAVVALQN